jgi:hypothetical protein
MKSNANNPDAANPAMASPSRDHPALVPERTGWPFRLRDNAIVPGHNSGLISSPVLIEKCRSTTLSR